MTTSQNKTSCKTVAVLCCQDLSAAAAAADGGGGAAATVVCRWKHSAQPVAHPTLQPSSPHVPHFECFGKTRKTQHLSLYFVIHIFQADFMSVSFFILVLSFTITNCNFKFPTKQETGL